MSEKLSLKEIESIIDQEINWCNCSTEEDRLGTTEEYRSGFVKGLEQVKYLITELYAGMETLQ